MQEKGAQGRLVEEEAEQEAFSYTLSLQIDEMEFHDCDLDEERGAAGMSNQARSSSDVQAQGSVDGARPHPSAGIHAKCIR